MHAVAVAGRTDHAAPDLSQSGAPEGVTQIVKLHGDFDDEYAIVLTESSHFDRLGFDSPLDLTSCARMRSRIRCCSWARA